jgi:type I restriction enzyme M protein
MARSRTSNGSKSDKSAASLGFEAKLWLAPDPRWRYGTPPRGNANFAWIQHMLHHLAPQGSMALLLANGSMSSGSGGEGQIRQASSKPISSSAWSRSPAKTL